MTAAKRHVVVDPTVDLARGPAPRCGLSLPATTWGEVDLDLAPRVLINGQTATWSSTRSLTSTAVSVEQAATALGTIAVGKRADFLLVDGDPLADIRALRRIRVVVAGGKAYDPSKLWRSVDFRP